MKHLCLLSFIIVFFLSCKDRVKKENKEKNLFYDRAFVYEKKGMTDSAFYYFNKAKDLFLQQKDSLNAGKCLIHMSIISTDKGDWFGAQEISLNALSYFDQKNEKEYMYICGNYNSLGIATDNLLDYKSAMKFYDLAISFSRDSLDICVYLNNKAKTYEETKQYREALKAYGQALKMAHKNKKSYAMVLNNISSARWLQDPGYDPVPDLLKALHIREEQKDSWGQNSSYSHLADYYTKKATDSALIYAKKMYRVAREINSADDQLEALQKLIKLSPPKETKQYFETYKNLDDSLQTARRAAKNQFALIRYETEKHKADFLKARAENVQKQNDILRKNAGIGVLALFLIFGYWWYRKRKKILYQEKELEVKNTEIKYVKKIHDGVANKLYQLISEVENQPVVDKDNFLDKMEILYNISRDISYENKEFDTAANYAEQLSEMLQSYSSVAIKILIVGNEEELWESINNVSKSELFCVVQELMTNMKKHSKAKTVLLKFQRNDFGVNILYTDDGVGMKDAAKKNGLTNTENRIKNIRGTITFDNTLKKGLEIKISCPFA